LENGYSLADNGEKFALATVYTRDIETHLEHAIRVPNSIAGNPSFDRTFPAENTILIANKGAEVIVRGSVKGTKNRTSYSGEIGKPIRMELSQVGPRAADPVCDGGEQPVMSLPPNDLKVVIARP
jgi:hypothetical protein